MCIRDSPQWYQEKVLRVNDSVLQYERNNLTTFLPAIRLMKDHCHESQQGLQLLHDMLTGPSILPHPHQLQRPNRLWDNRRPFHRRAVEPQNDREKRQALVLAGAAISALATGAAALIWGGSHSSSQADKDLKANQEHIIAVLREDEHAAALNEEKLERMHLMFQGRVGIETTEINHGKQMMYLMASIMAHSLKIQSIIDGITDLIVNQRLSPKLVRARVLARKLHKLETQAALVGQKVVCTREHEIFKFEASYMVYENLTVRGVIHIPAYPIQGGGDETLQVHSHPTLAGPAQ